MGRSQNWGDVMKYQKKNGSLFNSPSATASALTYLQDDGCLSYLRKLIQKFGHAVPTIYPFGIYARLCMVDTLQRLGIDHYFRTEIQNVVELVYRCWLAGEEEILSDPSNCAMAFRLLRIHGYDICSDPLTQFIGEEQYFNSLEGYIRDIGIATNLYKASHFLIHPSESDIERKASWISQFLKEQSTKFQAVWRNNYDVLEVENVLLFPDCIALWRNLEQYDMNEVNILKTSYCYPSIRNEELLKLAVEDFNTFQLVQQEELKMLERWVVDNKIDTLKFARQKLAYSYFVGLMPFFSPEQSDARISLTKASVLLTVVDDFFDGGGTQVEMSNLIHLIQKWDVNLSSDCCSENVQIIFSAIQGTIREVGEKALARQGRDVTSYVIELWLWVLKSMMKEAEWSENNATPTVNEYLENGVVSFTLVAIILPALFLLGPKLEEEIVRSPEYRTLFEAMSICGRLLNDIQSFERESKQGKQNAVSLYMIHDSSISTEEEAKEVAMDIARTKVKELLRLVLTREGSRVPRVFKDALWGMAIGTNMFYLTCDGYSSEELTDFTNSFSYEPVNHSAL